MTKAILSNEKRNPVLFRHEYDTSYLCGIDGHKKVTILGGHALYYAIREELEKITRPVVRARSEESEWIEFEPGAVTDVLGRWRSQVLEELASKCGIADHSQHLETIYQVEAEQAAWKAEEASS